MINKMRDFAKVSDWKFTDGPKHIIQEKKLNNRSIIIHKGSKINDL